MRLSFGLGYASLATLILSSSAWAQWSQDPAVNLPVGDAASDQNQVKLATDPVGNTWVSWFDGIGSGWDVRLQKLDSEGREAFAHNGVNVADRGFSSTQDYGLDAFQTNAYLAFRDDRSGSTEITAACISGAGLPTWGPNGVALTSGAGFVAAPKVAVIWGNVFVAWTENSSVKLQKLNLAGVVQWATPLDLTPATGSYIVADLQGSGPGVFLSIVHQTGGFTSPKHLVAQKFDPDGVPLWGATPIPIFDGGSLQFGNYPDFTTDANGGAVFSWYSSSPSLQCLAQRVDSAGTEYWAHNGIACATTAGQLRVAPHVSYDAVGDDVYVAWKELNGSQSQSGVSAQRIDSSGGLLWGASGTALKALGGPDHNLVRIIPGGISDGALVLWSESPSFGNDQLYGAHVDAAGSIDRAQFDVASTPSGKTRLAVTTNAATYPVIAWSDGRNDGGDILAQSMTPDGALDTMPTGSVFCDQVTDNSTGQPTKLVATWLTGNGLGTNLSDLHLEMIDGVPGQLGYILIGTEAQVGIPVSNGHLCLAGTGGQFFRYNVGGTNMSSIGGFNASGTLVNSAGTSATGTGFDVPALIPGFGVPFAIVAGETWHFQGWHRDTPAGVGSSNLSTAVSVQF
ncbi:MAG: hypothetical protein ACI9X4_000434 [Glaciecola sp.]|jgi:hypothetical protein